MKKLLKERFQQLAGLRPLYGLNEVRGPIKNIEINIRKGEGGMMDELRDDYGFEENVDGVPIEDLFDDEGIALRDMSVIYGQRDDMYLMDTEDIEKYH